MRYINVRKLIRGARGAEDCGGYAGEVLQNDAEGYRRFEDRNEKVRNEGGSFLSGNEWMATA